MANSPAKIAASPSMKSVKAYKPSWFDRLSAWADQLPVPYGLVYLLLSLLLLAISVVAQAIEDSDSLSSLDPFLFIISGQIWFVFTIMHYLDKYALKALNEFKPALKIEERDFPELQKLLSTLPAGRTLLACFGFMSFALALIFVSQFSGEVTGSTVSFSNSPAGYFMMANFLLLWLINGLFVYHTVHQLRAVSFLYTNLTEVYPFRQRELYAFSGFSARTGISILLLTPLWIIFDPGLTSLTISIAFALFGLIAFLSPLSGIHRILEQEKDQLLDKNAEQMEETIFSLMSQLRSGNLEDIDQLDKALTSLEKVRGQIERISTWPWRMDLLKQMIAAVFLPILIWLIQYFLSQYI